MVESNNFTGALTCFTRAPQGVKDNTAIRILILDVHFRMHHMEDVAILAAELLSIGISDEYRARLQYLLSASLFYYSSTISFSNVLELLESSLTLCSGNEEIGGFLEKVLWVQGVMDRIKLLNDSCSIVNQVKSIEDRDSLVARSEWFCKFCLDLASKCLEIGSVADAILLARKSIGLAPLVSSFVEICERAAFFCVGKQNFDLAIKCFSYCIEFCTPPNENVLYGRACAFQKKCMFREALADFVRLSSLNPSSTIYDEMSEEIKNASKLPRYYTLLGVSSDATTSQIKKAFRKLALETHPDKLKDEKLLEASTALFREVCEAYLVLSNEEKRRQYDAENI